MKILAFDPSLRNWGFVSAERDDSTKEVTILSSGVIKTTSYSPKKHSGITRAIHDINTVGTILETLVPLLKQSDIVVTETPIGSQSAAAMKGYGIVIAILAVCRKVQPCFVTATPKQLKVSFTGNPEASKNQMIDRAVQQFPTISWPVVKRNGELRIVAGEAEHIADAAAALDYLLTQNITP